MPLRRVDRPLLPTHGAEGGRPLWAMVAETL
jgi:hypothetical protein